MDEEKRRYELLDFFKHIPNFNTSYYIYNLIDQEKAMIKAAEDKAVLEFAKEFIEFHKTGYGYHCGNSMTDLRIDNLITEIKSLLTKRGIKETV